LLRCSSRSKVVGWLFSLHPLAVGQPWMMRLLWNDARVQLGSQHVNQFVLATASSCLLSVSLKCTFRCDQVQIALSVVRCTTLVHNWWTTRSFAPVWHEHRNNADKRVACQVSLVKAWTRVSAKCFAASSSFSSRADPNWNTNFKTRPRFFLVFSTGYSIALRSSWPRLGKMVTAVVLKILKGDIHRCPRWETPANMNGSSASWILYRTCVHLVACFLIGESASADIVPSFKPGSSSALHRTICSFHTGTQSRKLVSSIAKLPYPAPAERARRTVSRRLVSSWSRGGVEGDGTGVKVASKSPACEKNSRYLAVSWRNRVVVAALSNWAVVRRGVARLRAKTGRTKKGNPRGRRGERYTHPHTRTPRTRRRVASCSVRARTRLAVVCAPGPGPPPLPSVPGSPTPSLRPQQSARRGDTRAPCVPLPDLSLPLPAALRDPARTPGDKGASATLHAGSGRLVSRIGRLFETASRVA